MKVAVLGSGEMGETVIGHLQKCSDVSSITAYDTSLERLEILSSKHNIETTSDLNALLADKQLRLVFVTAPNHAHKQLTLSSLQAGKAVMCEKPIATTLADAKEIVDKAKELNAFLQIGFELRYSTLYTTVKKWIDDGLLGDIVNTSCTYICSEFHGKGSWRNVKSTGGNMVGEKLSHYLDLARWWTGSNVKDIYTACAPNIVPYYEVHDNYHMTYRFKNGAIGHMTFVMAVAATFHGDPLQDVLAQQRGDGHDLQFLIVGTKGAAQTNVFNRSLKRWEFGDSEKCLTSNWVENITWSADEDHYRFHNTTDQTLDIVRRVKESLPPKTSAEDAFETMKLCFAAEKSADTGCITELSKVTD